MRQFLLTLAFLITAPVLADVPIPQEARVKNFPSGCCVWATIETLGNYYGIKSLKGITAKRDKQAGEQILVDGVPRKRNDAPGNEERVHQELKALKVNYKLYNTGSNSLPIVKEYLDKGIAVGIGVKNYPGPGDHHFVILTEYTDKTVEFIDPNTTTLYESKPEWVTQLFTGYLIIIVPPEPVVIEERFKAN